MADNKPVLDYGKARYIAPLALAAVVAVVLVVIVARQNSTAPPPPAPPAKPPMRPAQPQQKMAVQPLDRADLIAHARELAGTFAVKGTMPSAPDPLIGRRFSVRIAFGCGGISGGASGSQTSLAYDSQNQTVTITARPVDWTALPLVRGLKNASDIEAVEGFWLSRAWLDSDACPANFSYVAPATQTPPTGPTLGFAQIFLPNGSRVARHSEHPYEFTRKVPADQPDFLNHSYRLVLEGSIGQFANRQALQCWVESPDHQPICLYAVRLETITFEDGETGEVLAKWTD